MKFPGYRIQNIFEYSIPMKNILFVNTFILLLGGVFYKCVGILLERVSDWWHYLMEHLGINSI